MKIGILSLNPGHNYGGMLQSYALKSVLERMGHKVKVVMRDQQFAPSFSLRNVPRYVVRLLRKLFKGSQVPIFAEYRYKQEHLRITHHTWGFCTKYLNLKRIKTFMDIHPKEFDAFVVGSDQVWRPIYFEKQYKSGVENAYLSFTHSWDVMRIAYAPSFGVEEWEYTPEQTQRCSMFLSHFDAVSVREESGVTLCREILNRTDAVQLCDPTMLLLREDYERLITPDTPPSKGNLLVYCLDKSEELDTLVSRISKEKNLTPFNTNVKAGKDITIEERIMPSVESWLRAFQDAEFVITDSFHACVFSLIFHKPFLVFGNKERGMSRFETLLTTFGQTDRLLFRSDDYSENKTYSSFDHIDEVFANLRQKAIQFLNDSLQCPNLKYPSSSLSMGWRNI